ncbi:Uncharacterized protein Fot_04872 [Forsythia ovata]|uniref:Uncharacterized protein n=1 Tax=Forsythia ovata TaxID=205694 RepID=A0ABD1WRE8_9LAMI
MNYCNSKKFEIRSGFQKNIITLQLKKSGDKSKLSDLTNPGDLALPQVFAGEKELKQRRCSVLLRADEKQDIRTARFSVSRRLEIGRNRELKGCEIARRQWPVRKNESF